MQTSPYYQQNGVRCTLMRGGTSKGPFFMASDLPQDAKDLETALLRALGAMTASRIDGIGGLDTLSNKIAVVSRSDAPEADVDYLFFQAKFDSYTLDRSVNCGNMLAGVGPFAIERGLVPAQDGTTTVRIRNLNTAAIVHAIVQTPGGRVTYDGGAAIDGVAGTAAPILLDFRNIVGTKTGRLLPTGQVRDTFEGVAVTCMDVAIPMVLIPAEALGLKGHETPDELNTMTMVKARIERIRCLAGERMGLGDVSKLVMPKVALLSAPRHGGSITSRYLTPHSVHTSHAVTGALCIGTACSLPGSVAAAVCAPISGGSVAIEHPSGSLTVLVSAAAGSSPELGRASLMRTARKLFEGELFLSPAALAN